jgi:hypothetical protein
MPRCNHDIAFGKKPGSEICRKCDWTYPCKNSVECSHFDCVEFRQKMPKCWYCKKTVEGSPEGFSARAIEALSPTKGEPWTIWPVRGITRAVHYTCRNEHVSENKNGPAEE